MSQEMIDPGSRDWEKLNNFAELKIPKHFNLALFYFIFSKGT